MSEAPWLTIVGLGEDGLKGLTAASQTALETAEIIMGPARHLDLVGEVRCETRVWPTPFADGIAPLLDLRGRRVVVLASGDPFWYGAGTVLARHLAPSEWQSLPGLSTFSQVANRLGWALETVRCYGLHAAPLGRLRPDLAPGAQIIALLRDGAAVRALASYLSAEGFGASQVTICEALGGPRETVTRAAADDLRETQFCHPVCAAIEVQGTGAILPFANGRPDSWFENDGQITKRPIRAMTLSALAPRAFETLWDIGGGSGSIAIEWLLADQSVQAISVEQNPGRAVCIQANAARLGVDRLRVVTGSAPAALSELPKPQAVFIGGGLSGDLLAWLEHALDPGTRLVVNAVTLESEALVIQAQARLGGDLIRLELSRAEPLGPRRGWKSSYPIVQWSVTL